MVTSRKEPPVREQASLRNGWTRVTAVVLALALSGLILAPAGWAQPVGQANREEASHGTPSGAGLQAASWLLTVPYGAVKVGFALLGGIVGGFTYLLSGGNTEAAKSVWTTTMYGTYVITPEHLNGEKPIRFLGVPANSGADRKPPSAHTVPETAEPTQR